MKMEAEGGGGGNSVTGNSSDSGSGGIIDVSTVSSNFNAPTPQTSASKNIVLSWYTLDGRLKSQIGNNLKGEGKGLLSGSCSSVCSALNFQSQCLSLTPDRSWFFLFPS